MKTALNLCWRIWKKFTVVTFNKSYFPKLFSAVIYSLVPKEGYGCTCTPRLCIEFKESHDSTFSESINPKEIDWLFLVHKMIPKFGYDPKKRHDHIFFVKRLDQKESHGSIYWQCIGPNESQVQNEKHMSFFKHQRRSDLHLQCISSLTANSNHPPIAVHSAGVSG